MGPLARTHTIRSFVDRTLLGDTPPSPLSPLRTAWTLAQLRRKGLNLHACSLNPNHLGQFSEWLGNFGDEDAIRSYSGISTTTSKLNQVIGTAVRDVLPLARLRQNGTPLKLGI